MAYGIQSEEEKRKKKEEFERKRSELGFGVNNQPAGFIGAGKLAQQAPQAVPRQSPQMATRNAAAEREQALAQRSQLQAKQKADQAASMQNTRRDIQEILKLPAKEQPQAVQRLRQNSPAQPQANPQPKQPFKSTSALGDTAISTGQAVARTAPLALGAADLLTGGMASDGYNKLADSMEPFKSTYEPPRQAISQAGKSGISNQMEGMGMQLDFPIKKQSRGEDQWDPRDYPSVYAGKQADPVEPIAETYVEQPQQTTPPRIGFDPVNNPQTIQRSGGGNGFRMPNAPMRSWSESQEREALLRDASTAYKGSQNGQLTAKQMEIRAGIIGADDKYKNDRYGAQLSAASQLAQTQMSQDGANERAALGEANSNSRFNSQLGFDAGKFQQTAEQQQQANSLAARRLDIEQSNSDVANYAPKQLNALYEKYDTAQSDEDRSAVAAQIQTLKGTNDKSDKEYWTNIGGGETLSADGLTSTKNPDILLNRNTGETRALPAEPIDYESDPRAQAIINDRSLSKDERRKQLEALR